MNFIDYRKKLGLAFSDDDKLRMLKNKVLFLIENHGYFEMADINGCLGNIVGLGDKFKRPEISIDYMNKRYYSCYEIYDFFNQFEGLEFIYNFVILLNYMSDDSQRNRNWSEFERFFEECKIPVEIIEDSDGKFVFEKGAKELDDVLVSEPLEWLKAYPDARSEFISALKAYQDVTLENARDVSDKFRKALEQFFKEFFKSNKSLDNLISEYGAFLKEHGIPKEISNNFEKILGLYKDFMNDYSKHKTGEKASTEVAEINLKSLEYIMHQTGAIIRLLCTLKNK